MSLHLETNTDINTIEWAETCDFLTDFDKSKDAIGTLLSEAKSTVYYSTFVCDFYLALPTPDGGSATLLELIKNAVKRGVKVHILFNPYLDYGTTSVEKLLTELPKEVDFHNSVSNLGPGWFSKHFTSNSKYAYQHAKYLCVDGDVPNEGKIMVTGCDIKSERRGWLKLNPFGYYWHEPSAVTPCTEEMYEWIKYSHNVAKRLRYDDEYEPAPFPLVNGGWQEENAMVDMILKAEHSIHLENQLFMSGGSEQENRINRAIVERIARGIANNDDFYAMILTNSANKGEPSKVARWYTTVTLEWSINGMIKLAKKHGMTREQLFSRLLIGHLEHEGTMVKVHSNLIIQDGYRCIRSSSNLTDRSLSHRPCDVEAGILVKGDCVKAFQQQLFNMYCNTTGKEYTLKMVLEKVVQESEGCNIKSLESRGWSRKKTKSLMKFFIGMSGGATGGKYKVTFKTYDARVAPSYKTKPFIAVKTVADNDDISDSTSLATDEEV